MRNLQLRALPASPASATILVVEDDGANRALLGRILELERYRVVAIGDGADALAAVRREEPDLVVLDVGLPHLDGFEITRQIRSDQRWATLPVLLLTGRSGTDELVTGLDAGADDFITKPFVREELLARIRSALRLRSALVGMEAAHGVVMALANAIEAKDIPTEQHCQRLAHFAVRLGEAAGLGAAELDAVAFGALLHDVGKIGVPDFVLAKAGPLTDAEWGLIRRHPEIGERICAPLAAFAVLGPIVRHHHERWDGRGYPDGLRAGETPLGARIVGLVDAFDAMTHDRPYRTALSVDAAADEIRRCAGQQFDPELAAIFTDSLGRQPSIGPAELAELPAALLTRRLNRTGDRGAGAPPPRD